MSETWSRIVSVSSSLILWPSEAHRARSSCEVKGNGLGAVGRSVDVQKAKGGQREKAKQREGSTIERCQKMRGESVEEGGGGQ